MSDRKKEIIEEMKTENRYTLTSEGFNEILELFNIPLPEVSVGDSDIAVLRLIGFLLEAKIEAQEKIKELELSNYCLKTLLKGLKKERDWQLRGTVLLPKECEEYVEKLNAMSEKDRRAFLNGTWTNTAVEDPYDSEEVNESWRK